MFLSPSPDIFKPYPHKAHGWQSMARMHIVNEWPPMCWLCMREPNKTSSVRVECSIDMQYAKWPLYGFTLCIVYKSRGWGRRRRGMRGMLGGEYVHSQPLIPPIFYYRQPPFIYILRAYTISTWGGFLSQSTISSARRFHAARWKPLEALHRTSFALQDFNT